MSFKCLCCLNRDAGHFYACHHCVDDMRRWLRELEDYAVILVATLGPLRDQTIGSIGAAFSSSLPLRDDVATLLDYRSGAGAGVHRLHDPRDMDDEPVRSLPGGIHGIACWLREERDLSEPRAWTLTSELRYLRTEISSCAIEQWVDELYTDLRELHRQARQLAVDVPRPLGVCLTMECDGKVFWAISEHEGARVDQARCVACQRIYTGLDLVRLGVAQEAG